MDINNTQIPSPFAPLKQPSIFSAKGRIGRLGFAAWNAISSFIITLAIIAIILSSNDFPQQSVIASCAMLALYVAFLYWSFILTIKRLHDCNQSDWMSLLSFLPVVNFIFFIYLYCAKGQLQNNEYGTPRPTATWEKIIAWLFCIIIPLLMVIGVAAILLAPHPNGIGYY